MGGRRGTARRGVPAASARGQSHCGKLEALGSAPGALPSSGAGAQPPNLFLCPTPTSPPGDQGQEHPSTALEPRPSKPRNHYHTTEVEASRLWKLKIQSKTTSKPDTPPPPATLGNHCSRPAPSSRSHPLLPHRRAAGTGEGLPSRLQFARVAQAGFAPPHCDITCRSPSFIPFYYHLFPEQTSKGTKQRRTRWDTRQERDVTGQRGCAGRAGSLLWSISHPRQPRLSVNLPLKSHLGLEKLSLLLVSAAPEISISKEIKGENTGEDQAAQRGARTPRCGFCCPPQSRAGGSGCALPSPFAIGSRVQHGSAYTCKPGKQEVATPEE